MNVTEPAVFELSRHDPLMIIAPSGAVWPGFYAMNCGADFGVITPAAAALSEKWVSIWFHADGTPLLRGFGEVRPVVPSDAADREACHEILRLFQSLPGEPFRRWPESSLPPLR